MTTPPAPRRLLLHVAYGPVAGLKVAVEVGQTLVVGRSDDADLRFPHDRTMGARHFELRWDGARATVTHLRGVPTLVGGDAIEQATCPHGGWIRAGETFFGVHVENHAPPSEATPNDPAHGAHAAAIARALRGEGSLWAVLDATRHERIVQAIREAVDPARSLYEGVQGLALDAVAPWLVQLRPDSHLLDLLIREGWGDSWGIYFTSDAPEKALRRHLRRFLLVEDDETRERLYFRFYDPRVLRVFLPTCSTRQLHELFGEIDAFHLEGETGELLRFAARDVAALAAEPSE